VQLSRLKMASQGTAANEARSTQQELIKDG
jgi:hypothetical protein